MALKFRRGTTAQKSGSLAFGEPYVNTSLGTLQVGLDTGDVTLATQGTSSLGQFGEISGSGLDITGNANIAGNLTLGGTITIGDNTSDNVVVNADLSSSIIPNNDNAFDLGSTSSRYRAIYGANLYGAINATNGVVSGSSQVVGILSSLNTYTGSNDTTNTLQSTRIDQLAAGTASVNSFTSSQSTTNTANTTRFQRLEESTASLNAFSASENTKAATLQTYTASVDTKFAAVQASTSSLNTFTASNGNTSLNAYTASNDTTNTTQNTRLTRLEESTASLNAYTASNNTTNTLQTTRIDQLVAGTASVNLQTASVAGHITDINTYTSSLKTAFSVSGADLTVLGNLTVQGDTVTLNVANLLVEDKVIEIASGSTTSAAANGAGIFISGANASILWDNAASTLDINKSIDVAGNITLTGTVDGVDVSVQDTLYTNKFSTLQTYTASVDSTLARLRESTASLNVFSASENTKAETLRLYTASIDTKFSTLATYTGSNDTTNTTQNTRLSRIEESTASINLTTASLNGHVADINTWSASVKGHIADINTYTGSNNTTNTTQNTRLSRLEESTSSLNTFSASALTRFTRIEESTASLNAFSASQLTKDSTLQTYTASIDSKFSTLQTYTASVDSTLARLRESTASLNTFSASENTKAETLRLYTASIDTKFSTLATYTGSNDTTNTTQNTRLSRLEESTSSLNAFTSSQNTTNTTYTTRFTRIEESTASLNAFSASENTKLETLRLYTASVDAKFSTLQTYTASVDTTNTTQNTRLNRIEESTSSLNTLTASLATTYEGRASAAKVLVSGSSQVNFTQLSGISANIISGSTNSTNVNFTISGGSITANLIGGVVSGSSQITAGSTTNFATDVKTQLNSNTVVSGSSQVNFTQLAGISANIISSSSDTANVDMIINGGSISANLFGGVVSGSAQVVGMLASLNSYTASNDTTNTTQNSRLDQLSTASGSAIGRLTNLESYSSSLRTAITVAGSDVTVNGNLTVAGTTTTINSTTVAIGDNIIQLNGTGATNGGIVVRDATAATTTSGSLLWDTTNDKWIAGPLGSEDDVVLRTLSQTLTNKTISGASNTLSNIANASLTNSSITIAGQSTALGGTITAETIRTAIGTVVTGSAQVVGILASLNTYTGSNDTTNTAQNARLSRLEESTASLNAFSASENTKSETLRLYTASIDTKFSTLATYTASVDTTNTTQNTRLTRIEESTSSLNTLTASLATTYEGRASAVKTLFSGSSQITGLTTSNLSATAGITNGQLANSSITIAGQSTALGSSVTAETIRTAIGAVVTGSSQISHDSTTGYSANRHVDHTAVSITAGSGLTGGGDISTTRTISIATGGVTDSMLAGSISNSKLTNSSITIAGQSTALGSSVTAETIRTAIGTVVTGSAQIDLTATTNYATGILTRLNTVGVFSGSSQVSHDSTTGYSANKHVDHTAVSITAGSGLTGGGDISTTRTISIANLGVTDAMLAGSISNAKLTNSSITIAGQSTSLGSSVTAETIRTAIGTVVTGSAQITGIGNAQLTNSSVTVTAGTGMSGGGSVALGSSITLTNAGVTSNVAGSGISVSGATGAVTITNTGVRSIAAGTGVSVSATTGDSCTISIGQSVATSATPTFDYIMTSNNGNGTNYKVGDDAWIGDMNTANTIKLKGVQDATAGYITFGNQSTALGLTNSTTLTWGASFTATGDVTAYSDRRVKENIKTIDGALDKVLKLRGVTYNRIDVDDKSEKIGVIAQEIQEVLPQVVHDENDKLSVAYGNLAGIFIEAIKEQQSQIHKLTLEIEELKKQKGL